MGLNKASRIENASRNVLSALTNRVLILLLTFICRKIFIHYIGIEYLGINGLFINILTLLSMADLGIGTAMNVSLYKPIAEKDTKRISALINFYRQMYLFIAIGVTAIGIGIIPFLKYLINLENDIPYIYLYYLIFVLKNSVSYLLIYKSSLIRADQKNYLINRVEAVISVLKVTAQIVVIVWLKNYFFYIIIDVFAIVLHNILVSCLANHNYPFIDNTIYLSTYEKKNIFSEIYSIFLYKVAWSLLNGTDNILMSVLCGTLFVGLYSNYFTITNNIEGFIALLFTSLTASIGNLIVTSSEKAKYDTFQSLQMISFWICGIVTTGLFFLTQDFIELWLGKDLLLDNLTLIAIVLNVFFSICMRPVWTFREGTGMYKNIKYIMFITAIINLVLSIILGYWLGVSGILFATSISKLCTYFWYEPNILFKRYFNVKPIKYYIQHIINIVVLFVSFVICYFSILCFDEVSLINWIIKAIILVLVVNIVYFLRYYKTSEFKNVFDKLVSLLFKTK